MVGEVRVSRDYRGKKNTRKGYTGSGGVLSANKRKGAKAVSWGRKTYGIEIESTSLNGTTLRNTSMQDISKGRIHKGIQKGGETSL